ncbi:Cupredoxin [Aspergillus californicus]
MLLRSLLVLLYALCASASWVFNHDPVVEGRSAVLSPFSNPRHERRASQNITQTGSKPCKQGDKHCTSRPTTTRATSTRTGKPTGKPTQSATTLTTSTTTTTSEPTATPCAGNTPDTRSSWCDYSIDTNYHEIVPNTGVTREYWLEIDEMIGAPDGFARPVMAVNRTIPGPTIYADWGDEVVVHVKNYLHESLNGTTIHWHGIRQLNTNQNDGVVSITQCPITPDHEYTYRWRAQQYGSSWYHSHMGLQAWDGIAGGIVINGPATANYDVDMGTIMLNDWPHQTADELFWVSQLTGPPQLTNALINGTNIYGHGKHETGKRFTMKAERDTSYRLRLINAALDTHFKFMIDNHKLTVIAMDLVPVEPFTVTSVSLAMGQRYDVIVTADQGHVADSFWIRSIPQQACSDIENTDVRGIFHYSRNPKTPKTQPWLFDDSCTDEPLNTLIPHVPRTVEPPQWEDHTDVTVGKNDNNFFRWYLNSTSMGVYWEDPTLLQVANNERAWAASSGIIDLPNANEWVYLIINTTIPVSHPIHLHGHDFFILAQGTNPWDGVMVTENPPRRDTAVLPGNGYLVMAWETDNPGAWLMHCHIGWHTTEGFALQFVERYDEIAGIIDEDELRRECSTWSGYDQEYDVEQHDSGI